MLTCPKLKCDMVAIEAGHGRTNQAAGIQHDDNHVDSANAPEQGNHAKQWVQPGTTAMIVHGTHAPELHRQHQLRC